MRKLFLLGIIFLISNTINAQLTTDLQTKVENVSATSFNEMIQKDANAQLIDIRTPGEFKAGHIKNAKSVNFYDPSFAKNIEALKLDKNQAIYVYCRSGHRSGNSLRIFKSLGFSHIVNLAYGINDWFRSGLPVER